MSETPEITLSTIEQFFGRALNAITTCEADATDFTSPAIAVKAHSAKAQALATLTAGMMIAQAIDRLADLVAASATYTARRQG
jgi:hypothetical protein